MQKFIRHTLLLLVALSGRAFAQGGGPLPPVPDTKFIKFLKAVYPSTLNEDGRIIPDSAAKITGDFNCSGASISSLDGIQSFINIRSINAARNNISSFPYLYQFNKLVSLNLDSNQVNTLPGLNGLPQLVNLQVANNKLSYLPLDDLRSLESINCSNNYLTNFASTSQIPNLKELDISNNRIQNTPDFSTNKKLKTLNFSNNSFSHIPPLNLDSGSLKTVDVKGIKFTFQDLIKYADIPNFSNIFILPDSSNVKISTTTQKEVIEYQNLYLSTGIDEHVDSMLYTWYFNGKKIGTVHKDTFPISSIALDQAGSYYCILSNAKIKNYELHTDTVNVSVTTCLNIASLSFSITGISCDANGTLSIKSQDNTSQQLKFTLKSPSTNSTITSESGIFTGLTEPKYVLTISSNIKCQKTYPEELTIPTKECIEAYITPDNDGEKDNYYFSQTGSVKIYDSQGLLVKSLTAPTLWDGSSKSTPKVAPGYYIADVNNGSSLVKITVVY